MNAQDSSEHQMGAERFVVPSQVFWKRRDDAVQLMRLGALANALVAVASMSAGTVSIGVGRDRDTLQTNLMFVSYLKEAIDAIDNKRAWQLIQRGIEAGYRLPKPIERYRQVFSRGRDSLYKRFVHETRNTKGFHIDKEHFEEWAEQLQSPSVTLWRKDSGSPLDWAFTASLQIQSFFGVQSEGLTEDVSEDLLTLPQLVEAMGAGLLAEEGLNPREYWVPMSRREVRIEYTFVDRRPPQTETITMMVDSSGDLHSVVHELRNRVTRFYGGRRAGAYLAGHDQPVVLSGQYGTARAWPGNVVDLRAAHRGRTAVPRLRDMAAWGKLRTQRLLDYVHDVRDGKASAEQTNELLAELRQDLDYWTDRERDVEDLVRRSRVE